MKLLLLLLSLNTFAQLCYISILIYVEHASVFMLELLRESFAPIIDVWSQN